MSRNQFTTSISSFEATSRLTAVEDVFVHGRRFLAEAAAAGALLLFQEDLHVLPGVRHSLVGRHRHNHLVVRRLDFFIACILHTARWLEIPRKQTDIVNFLRWQCCFSIDFGLTFIVKSLRWISAVKKKENSNYTFDPVTVHWSRDNFDF